MVGKNTEAWKPFDSLFTEKLFKRFCHPQVFEANYEEDLGKEFTTPPICDENGLRDQIKLNCREVSRHYMDLNPATGKEWSTKEMLTNITPA